MDRGKLYFLVSLPRAGKSIWADSWVRRPDCQLEPLANCTIERPRVVICGDDFRRALYGRSYQIEAEGTIFAMMDVAARALLNRGFDVLIDETCTTRETLLRYYRIDINAEPIFIETSKEVCLERAFASNKPYLFGPINRMAEQLDHLKKNWDSIVKEIKEYLRKRSFQDVAV